MPKKFRSFIITIIGAIIALGILVLIHEAGHFITARLFGVKVEKFSIGFGMKLLSFTKGETEYRISLIPLGGYVKMKGENPDEKTDDPDSYINKTWWQRALIAFSGPLANFLLALFVFIVSFGLGKTYEDYQPVIGLINNEIQEFQLNDEILAVNDHEVKGWNQIIKYTNDQELNIYTVKRDGFIQDVKLRNIDKEFWISRILPQTTTKIDEPTPGFPAYEAGLMKGDQIISVDSIEVKDWYEMRRQITTTTESSVNLKILRDGKIFNKTIELGSNLMDDTKVIGITQTLPLKLTENYSLLESMQLGTLTTVSFVALNYSMLYKLIANPQAIKDNMGGPVMIYTLSQQSAAKGWDSILSFFAAISIALMIMNLLPIPILDGGHIFFCIIEAIKGSPLSRKIQIALQNIGLVLLMMLMFFAFWNDISKIFERNVSIKQIQKTDG